MSTSTALQDGPISVEALINSGLRNLWYPVAPSWMVREAPIGVTRLGERIVLWRDQNGDVHAVEDRCPHRGARLSQGWNFGDRLQCWYHGVQIGTDGTVLEVPALPDCAMKGRKLNRSYAVKEIRGGIFLYFGDAAHPEPCDLELPEELTDEDKHGAILCTATWNTNYRYAIENVMDPMHGAYLHRESHSMSEGDEVAKFTARNTDQGYVFEKEGQLGVNFDWVEFGQSGADWFRLTIPYPPKSGPGGHFGIIGFATPVDETHTQVFFWRTREVSGWLRDMWHFLYRTRFEKRHWDVLEQDRVVLEAMSDDARQHENLYQHDGGVTRLRQIMHRAAEAQVKELAEAHAQAAE